MIANSIAVQGDGALLETQAGDPELSGRAAKRPHLMCCCEPADDVVPIGRICLKYKALGNCKLMRRGDPVW
jgi:hypothetical protein